MDQYQYHNITGVNHGASQLCITEGMRNQVEHLEKINAPSDIAAQ